MSVDFERIPGIGKTLARRLREDLDVHSLSALAEAAQDGRLGRVPGIGAARARNVRRVIADRLWVDARPPRLPVERVLALDAEFRREEAAGALPRAPDPAGGWRAVLRSRIDGHGHVVHWSRSDRARRMGRDHDWVVVRSEEPEGDLETVVTEREGPRVGRRVVRGREDEADL